MDPNFLTSRLKTSFFRKGYTLKKKHLDEVAQMIELSNLDRQQLTEELARLKQDLYATEREKENFKRQCQGLSEKLNDTDVSFQVECQTNSALRTEYDNVSSKLNEIQVDCAMKLKAAAEKDHAKDEKIQQLMSILDKISANPQAQKLQRLSEEKSQLEKLNKEIVKNMDIVQTAYNKTDTRRKQLEYEITGLKDKLEKMRSGKLAIEAQLLRKHKQNSVRKLHSEGSLKDLSEMLLSIQNVKNPEQSTQLIEKFANGIQLQMFQQQQEYEAAHQDLIKKNSVLEQQNAELIEKLCTLQNTYNENEERRMQVEAGFSTLKDEIEKLKSGKMAIDEKFSKSQSKLKKNDCLENGDSILLKNPSI